MRYSFKNDYSEGAHPRIIEALLKYNMSQEAGYGEDQFSKQAKNLIRNKINNPEASIFFLSGGTQTNLICISALLRPHEAVISAKTGHIVTNETGAIEAVGHKILEEETKDGKLKVEHIEAILNNHQLRPHVVKPRLVYISNATELGSLYNREELKRLYEYCNQKNLILFMDGARLGQALLSSDLSWEDCAQFTHTFYIGGTKNGALLGEALVFNSTRYSEDFDYILKQKGALLAKGRILGLQFLELFQDDLYIELARKAKEYAELIQEALIKKGFEFLSPTESNQIFPILDHDQIKKLEEKFEFYVWKNIDENRSAIRLITSWATQETEVKKLISLIEEF